MPMSPPRHGQRRVDANRAAMSKDYNANRRVNAPFYKSPSWRKLRAVALKMNPLCVHCKATGLVNMADMVDHITPISEGGDRLSLSNLQPLCNYHHGVKTGKERAAKAAQAAQDAL